MRIPVRIILIFECDPGGQNPSRTLVWARQVDTRDHEANAILDFLFDLPSDVSNFAITPGAGMLNQGHSPLPQKSPLKGYLSKFLGATQPV